MAFCKNCGNRIDDRAVICPACGVAQGPVTTDNGGFGWGMLLVVGIVHTGIAYALYFGAIKDVNAQTAAILSYLDPVLSIFLSALVLRQTVTVMDILGAVLILGSALYSELS